MQTSLWAVDYFVIVDIVVDIEKDGAVGIAVAVGVVVVVDAVVGVERENVDGNGMCSI